MNYLDLFSGIGGFALGAYWAGMKFENHLASEIEPYCQKLYQLRFPESIQLGDITKIDCEKLKKDYSGEWIITGSFPCQDISCAGKGAGIHGPRSSLWFEYWRIIRELHPRFAIIENVGAIVRKGLCEVLSCLAEIGYDAEWQDIRASDMGAPHKRERIWIIAYPNENSKSSMSINEKSGQGELVSNTNQINDNNTRHGTSEIFRKRRKETKIQICDTSSEGFSNRITKEMGRGKKRHSVIQFKRSNWWELKSEMDRVANGIPGRVDRLKGLGNSIVPQIACLLFEQIKDFL